jgi:hypothetical protein
MEREGSHSGLVWRARLPLVVKHQAASQGVVSEVNITVLPSGPRGVTWSRLFTMADDTDR